MDKKRSLMHTYRFILTLFLAVSFIFTGLTGLARAEEGEEYELIKADHKVFFDANGGTWTDEEAEEYYTSGADLMEEDGLLFPLADVVVRPGYDLDGWTKIKNGDATEEEPYQITEDITLYARWVKLPVVSFDLNGGAWAGTKQEQLYGSGILEDDDFGYHMLPAKNAVTWKDHVFEGWTETRNGTEIVDYEYMADGDTTLYARWRKICKITFAANGGKWKSGSAYAKGKTVLENEWLKLPGTDSISRKGYMLLGWTAKKNKGTVLVGDCEATGDVTLYARWVKAVSVTFDAGAGTFGGNKKTKQKVLEIASGSAVGDVITSQEYLPQNGNKVFGGWYKNKNCTSPVRESDVINKNVTFYAKWIKKAYKITVTNLKGASYVNRATGKYITGSASKVSGYSFYISEGDAIGSLSANKKGKEAKFYFDKACKQEPYYSGYVPTGDTTVYAKYLNTVTVKWNADGGMASGYAAVTGEGSVSSYESVLCEQLPAVVRKGYYFAGWYDVKTPSKILSSGYTFKKNTSVKAKWEKGIKITLNLKGGSFPANYEWELLPAFYVKAKATIASSHGQIPAPSKSGYIFTGWKNSVTKKTVRSIDSEKPSVATTYTAVWSKSFVKVTLVAGSGAIYDSIKDTYVSKATINVSKGTALSQVNARYNSLDNPSGQMNFAGWSLKKNGKVLKDSYKFTKSVTLYAIWAKKTDIRVIVVTNGGVINNKVHNDPYVYYVQKGNTISLPGAGEIKREGYKLAGWYTNYKCTSKIKTPGKFKPAGNCYVYAKWTK